MNEAEAIAKMIGPGQRRPRKSYREGVMQIWTTNVCDKACFGCTQLGQIKSPKRFITPEQFEQAVISLGFEKGDGLPSWRNGMPSESYFGVVGVFGANPALHPQFDDLCDVLQTYVPFEQRGLWCNNPLGHGKKMRETFNPAVSNLNVHLDQKAYDEFKRDWPEGNVFGLHEDSRHSPPWVAMQDIMINIEDTVTPQGIVSNSEAERHSVSLRHLTEEERWTLKSGCDINQYWSAMIGVFRGELRGYFCEVAGAQAIAHQDDDCPDCAMRIDTVDSGEVLQHFKRKDGCPTCKGTRLYPDLGSTIYDGWWKQPMEAFKEQARFHCDACGVPLRGYGELAQSHEGLEQVSKTHEAIFKPKRSSHLVQLVTDRSQLGKPLAVMTQYLQNSHK
jgi:hypothetical protein